MKKIVYLILMLIMSTTYGQTLKLVRTDVDSNRSSFVTATYLFGVDIYAKDLKRCNAVSFELRWNQTRYITFSEAILTDFSKNGTAIVTPPKINYNADEGKLFVGVLSGDSVGSLGTDNPLVIHLEFAVSQSSKDGDDLTFIFDNVQAVVSTDSGGKIIDILTPPVKYRIHGFIDVWPGDADNNGIVDQRDMSTVGLYLKFGSSFKNMRSFKRQPTSTIWTAQRSLAWDTLQATYADCDGNGDVTITDMLVIGLNFSKVKYVVNKNHESPQSNEFTEIVYNEPNSFIVPVKLSLNDNIKGIVGTLELPESLYGSKLIGVNRGNIFNKDDSYFYFNQNSEEINYAFISSRSTIPLGNEVCYLIFDKPVNNFDIKSNMNIINERDNIYQINQSITSVEEILSENESLIINNNIIYSKDNQQIYIYDYIGNQIDSFILNSGNSRDLSSYNCGVYYVKSTTDIKTALLKIIVY
jgi:hypothetical protein